jgi:hypothetical protein
LALLFAMSRVYIRRGYMSSGYILVPVPHAQSENINV